MGAGGYHSDAMWGAPYDPAWAQNDPPVNAAKLVANNTQPSAAQWVNATA
jgi:diacylglycerol O-acyltransferase/trehalose O-mycolyltransferase